MMKRILSRVVVAVLSALLIAGLSAIQARADEPLADPAWLDGNGGEPWPISPQDIGYQEHPGALTRWSDNGMVGRFMVNPSANTDIRKLPRVWISEPFKTSPSGSSYTQVTSRIHVRSGTYANGTTSPGDGGYLPLAGAILCQNTSTGQIRYLFQPSSGSASFWRRESWGMSTSQISITLGAANPCNRNNKTVFTSESGPAVTSASWANNTHVVVGMQWRIFSWCGVTPMTGGCDDMLASATWLPTNQASPVTPSLGECTSLFGQTYSPSSQVEINGQYFTAAQLGCDVYMDAINPDGDWATDFDYVCSNPPAASWTSFDWLPNWVGHYTNCLFVPQLGFPAGMVQEAANETGLGDASTIVSDIGDALPAGESCGQLVSGDVAFMGQIDIDTCNWTWASPMKLVLTIAVWILGVIAAVWIVIRAATGGSIKGGDEE